MGAQFDDKKKRETKYNVQGPGKKKRELCKQKKTHATRAREKKRKSEGYRSDPAEIEVASRIDGKKEK